MQRRKTKKYKQKNEKNKRKTKNEKIKRNRKPKKRKEKETEKKEKETQKKKKTPQHYWAGPIWSRGVRGGTRSIGTASYMLNPTFVTLVIRPVCVSVFVCAPLSKNKS